MKKAQVKVDYLGKIYLSNKKEVDEETIIEIRELITRISSGGSEFFSLENGNEEYYFSKDMINKSVITVTVYEN